jgi:hypothetical protein
MDSYVFIIVLFFVATLLLLYPLFLPYALLLVGVWCVVWIFRTVVELKTKRG